MGSPALDLHPERFVRGTLVPLGVAILVRNLRPVRHVVLREDAQVDPRAAIAVAQLDQFRENAAIFDVREGFAAWAQDDEQHPQGRLDLDRPGVRYRYRGFPTGPAEAAGAPRPRRSRELL